MLGIKTGSFYLIRFCFLERGLVKDSEIKNNIKSEGYIIYVPRCKRRSIKTRLCPFCKFDILAWVEGKIDKDENPLKS